MATRIFLVDDHPIVRQALRRLLEQNGLDVVGEARDAAEALRRAGELCPDVVVLDVARPVARCLSAAREIVRSVPLKGMILVAFEDYLVAEAFRAGARGYVLKARVAEDLPTAIQEVAGGEIYLSPGIPSAVVELRPTAANGGSPTP
ncbi:MAG: LuxR family transcriptional regulator [candidate division NC10 bacterium]|nr:LuxR family transcriptional regulator [candidate division NC10 bacterium]